MEMNMDNVFVRQEQCELQHMSRILQLIRAVEEKLAELNGYRQDYCWRVSKLDNPTGLSGHEFLKQLDSEISYHQSLLEHRNFILEEQHQRYKQACEWRESPA